jgi:hypothetical protein
MNNLLRMSNNVLAINERVWNWLNQVLDRLTLFHDDPHVLKNSGICKLSLQLQETSNANRIINYRYKMSSIQVQLLKRSVKPSK